MQIETGIIVFLVLIPVALFSVGYWAGYAAMRRECASIMTAGVPVPPAPVVYLSRGE